MLDEKALRRPEFAEGTRVKLGDGQEWSIPEYTITFFPDYDDDGRIVASCRTSFGADVDSDVDVWLGSAEIEPIERLSAMMRVASNLLLRNYDLDINALRTLLPKNSTNAEWVEMWEALTRVVLGQSPKA